MNTGKKPLLGSLALVLAAMIWGSAFAAQRSGMAYIGPYTFNAARCCIGALVLLPLILLFPPKKKTDLRETVLGGLLCGFAIFFATNLQQLAMVDTDAGKAGFITTFYIVLVPVMNLARGRRCGPGSWIAVGLALLGLYFLCMTSDSLRLQRGDVLLLLCALFYALQILLVDRYAPNVDSLHLSCIQFGVCGLLSLIPAFLLETPDLHAAARGWLPLLYTGILSCGVAYTLQIVGQKHLKPALASLIMSMESVFALLTGWILLHERLTGRQLTGCALVFIAVLLAQLWPGNRDAE